MLARGFSFNPKIVGWRLMESVIVVRDLEKTYRPKQNRKAPEVKAVDRISFKIPRGEFFGLLGPNGAGKTTTIGILTTRVLPTGGQALVDGVDVVRNSVAVKRKIGRSEEHTSELQSLAYLVCRLLLDTK